MNGDPAAGGGQRLAERVEEARHARIVLRPLPARQRLVREARQHGHDA